MPCPTPSPPISPRVFRAGLIVLDQQTGQVARIIQLQYNPDQLTRSFQVQAAGEGQGDRSEPLRLKGPPVETLKLEAEIDATDQLEYPTQNRTTTEVGLLPVLATLETLLYPSSAALTANDRLLSNGELEILPVEAPLTVLVFGRSRVIPVRLTELSVTEEAFDPGLNPIRAKVSLGLRVLSISDVTFASKAGSLFMAYLQGKERLATLGAGGSLGALGLTGVP